MKRNLTLLSLLFVALFAFGQPAAPTLTAPSNGNMRVSLTPTFSWGSVTGALTYTLIYSANADLSNATMATKGATNHTLGTGDLALSTTYYWTVYATDGVGNGVTADTFSFKTVGLPAPAPKLLAPAENGKNVSDKPLLIWSDVEDADSFQVEVSSDTNFVLLQVNARQIAADTQYKVNTSLQYNTMHYWRVRSINSGGESDWSARHKFTVKITPPDKPILISPEDNETGLKIRETVLTWDSIKMVEKYRVLVSLNDTFNKIVFDTIVEVKIRSLLLRNGLLLPSTDYFWTVLSLDTGDFTNEGDTFKFSTNIAPPADPTLVSPASASVNVGVSPTLTWNASPTATSYLVRIAHLTNFSDTVRIGVVTGTSYTTTGKLADNTVYYWRVRAENAGGVSDWSLYRNFTTLETGINDLGLEGTNLMNYPNPFISSTTISFDVVNSGKASIIVKDITGKEIATILDEQLTSGNHTVTVDASNWKKGIYFYTLTIDSKSITKTMVIQ